MKADNNNASTTSKINEKNKKKAYQKPSLISHGNVSEITKGGGGIPLDGLGTDLGGGGAS